MNYHELEKIVYEHLMKRREADPDFTFYVRQKPSKGAETDYFIGTENSNYFGFTLWWVKVNYPGASSDLLDFFMKKKSNGWHLWFEYKHPRTSENLQSELNWKLGLAILEKLKSLDLNKMGFSLQISPPKNKSETIKVQCIKAFNDVKNLLDQLDNLMALMVPMVDEEILQLKSGNPEWEVEKLNQESFEAMIKKMNERIELHYKIPHLNLDGKRIYKVSHGPDDIDQNAYNDFLTRSVIVVHKETKPKGVSKTSQGEYFTDQMKTGDYFYMCRGNEKCVLIGKVISDTQTCQWEDWGERGWVERKYELFKKAIKEESYNGEDKWWAPRNNSTCIEIKPKDFALANQELFEPFFGIRISTNGEYKNETSVQEQIEIMELNTILYGPPGTGKTYSTIDRAAKIIGFDTGSHEGNLKAFNERLGKNIEFITFHQSFAYEDFIEGIKPKTLTDKNGEKKVVYEIESGLFKRIAKEAEKVQLAGKTEGEFNRVFEVLKAQLEESEKDEINIPMKRVSFDITAINEHSINFRKSSGGTAHVLLIENLRKHYNSKTYYSKAGLGVYYNPLLDYLRKLAGKKQEEEIISNEPFVLIIDEINRGNVSAIFGELISLIETDKRSGAKNELRLTLPYSKTEFTVPSNLYLIGTMNTADRSVEALDTALRRRFSFVEIAPNPNLIGPKELITKVYNEFTEEGWNDKSYRDRIDPLYDLLGIEIDKIEEPLKKTAYAGHQWQTDDFDFLQEVDFKGINPKKLLFTINQRIEKLLNKDYMIGHAYFMSLADTETPLQALKQIFHNKIIPLLQEYFYGNFGKIELIIGQDFFENSHSGDNDFEFARSTYEDAGDLEERKIYQFKNILEMDDEVFRVAVIRIYNLNYGYEASN